MAEAGDSAVQDERARRQALFAALAKIADPQRCLPGLLRELRIHPSQQGIFRDLPQTNHLAPSGVALSVRHTGTSYADDLSDDAVIYHYPTTDRAGRDAAEIASLKAAQELALPVFVIVTPDDSSVREVRVGWVAGHNDNLGWVLISFEDRLPAPVGSPLEHTFTLLEGRSTKKYLRSARTGQAKFKFDVFARYGAACAACGLDELGLLEAAHLCPVAARGTNDPMNGLVLCANHHKALDLGLLRVKPESGEFVASDGAAEGLERLRVTARSLASLRNQPHREALRWLWDRFEPQAAP